MAKPEVGRSDAIQVEELLLEAPVYSLSGMSLTPINLASNASFYGKGLLTVFVDTETDPLVFKLSKRSLTWL